MKTFLGKIDAKLDSKGRVFIPASFRKLLPDGERERVVVRMDASCRYLVIYPEGVWNKKVYDLQSKLNDWDSEDQLLLMQFVSEAEMLDIDSQGRVLVSKQILSKLDTESEVTFVGMVDRIALWSKSRYDEFMAARGDFGKLLSNKMLNK